MLTAEELLQLLDKALEQAKDPGKKKEILKAIFEPLGYGFESEVDQATPCNLDMAAKIVGKFMELTATETKASYETRTTLRGMRVEALKAILKWLDGPAKSPYFVGAERGHVAIQMAMRVRKPSSMNQGDQGFCGPASVLVPWLKLQPLAFVQFVGGLFDNGTASFCGNTVDVKLATALLRGWAVEKGPAADFIALGSLRCNIETLIASPGGTGGLPFDFDVGDSHATTPAQIARLLTQAGYGNVQNHALSDYLAPRNGTALQAAGVSLAQCAQLLLQKPGAVVVMLVGFNIATAAKRGSKINDEAHVPKLADLHWVFVRRISATGLPVTATQQPLPGDVDMKLFTWRWSGPGRFKLQDFLPRYFGFVCGEPA